jgi:hypothetical protein
MMAKMFYTLEETKSALGRSEDEIKQLAREGRLREFRDGPRLMFKADQVDALRSELSGGGPVDHVDLGPSDSGAPIGLVDSKGASGSGISLVDSDAGGSRAGVQPLKDDTALAADLGLSGSMGGVPSPGRPSQTLSGSGLSGSKGGINVFGEDSVQHADPMAQTAISQGISDQVNLEGVGSGSGLLDLTRESDDTSLGAVLDEIGPSGATRTAVAVGGTSLGGAALADMGEPAVDRRPLAAPVMVQALDQTAPAFAGASAAGAMAVLFAMFVLISALVGAIPRETVKWLTDMGLFVIAGIGLGVSLALFAVGWMLGKTVKA